MTNPEEFYKKRITILNESLKKLGRRKSITGWLRLLTLAATGAGIWQCWGLNAAIIILIAISGITAFLFLVNRDTAMSDEIDNLGRLIDINKTELGVIAHQFSHLPDGKHLLPEHHPCAADLDLFGKASIYQYINRTETEQGHRYLADQLLYPSLDTSEVILKQEAVKELTAQATWRQQLQAHLIAEKITISTQEKISKWLAEHNRFADSLYWKTLRILLPTASFTFLALHLTGLFTASLFYPLIGLMLIISLLISRLVMPAWSALTKISPQLESLANSASLIEQTTFTSVRLVQFTHDFKAGQLPASAAIKKLRRILDMLDVRLNPLVFLPLNTFLFWDLQQVFALEKWKTVHQHDPDNWFSSLAGLESLSSLAALSFNHPGWVYPEFSKDAGVYEVRAIGHPLIHKEKSVTNEFATRGAGVINIITGSNMAGKSTFLRSAGCNLVLAMAGSPVCATFMRVSPMQVMSSMRISDNLEESTSTFYAELKKLKDIIEAVKERKRVFLLLDEILRGTNSADRHTGSKALIKQLVENHASGIVATHDIELTRLAEKYPDRIINYHFDVQVAGEELYFDYTLKSGICQSMNASVLMKKIGIDL